MTSYNTTKNKISYLFNQNQLVASTITNQQGIIKLNNNIITNTIPNIISIKKFITLDSGFLPMTFIISDPETNLSRIEIFTYNTIIEEIQEKYIPYILTNVILKIGNTEISPVDNTVFNFSSFASNEIIEVIDITKELKKVRILSTIILIGTDAIPLPDYQIRVVTTIWNPNYFK